jgi:hypothetical protein
MGQIWLELSAFYQAELICHDSREKQPGSGLPAFSLSRKFSLPLRPQTPKRKQT